MAVDSPVFILPERSDGDGATAGVADAHKDTDEDDAGAAMPATAPAAGLV